MILLGNGIGFGKKTGDTIDASKIQKKYIVEKESSEIERIINSISENSFLIARDIIDLAESELEIELNKSSYLLLADHIDFAIKRHEEKIYMPNIFINDIELLYPKELEIGIKAVEYIRNQTGIDIDSSESGFIAMHIINSRMDNSISNFSSFPEITRDIVEIIEDTYNIEINKKSIEYSRLVTHIKYLLVRISKKELNDSEEMTIENIIFKDYEKPYEGVLAIKKYIYNLYKIDLSNEEETYLTIHINRILETELH